jgi:WD40 repeat protein
MLALGFEGGRLALMDENTSEVKWDVMAHPTSLPNAPEVALSPNGAFVASFLRHGSMQWKLWNVENGVLHMVGAAHDGTGACICGVPELDHPPAVKEGCPVVAHAKGLSALTFSPRGQRLASGGGDGAVILWDARTGVAVRRMMAQEDSVISVSFSADGTRLASASNDRSICVWNVEMGALIHTILDDNRPSIFRVKFSPTNNRILASASHGQTVLWDVDGGERIRIEGMGFPVVFSPDGHTIAIVVKEQLGMRVNLVNAATGAVVCRMIGHEDRVTSVSFSDNGAMLATGSRDGTCKIWDAYTGELLRTIDVSELMLNHPHNEWHAHFNMTWGRDWVRDTQTASAVAMGHHRRLGAESRLLGLDEEVLRMILNRLFRREE